MRRIFPLFVVLLLVAVPVSAQTLGTITGEVKDGSGAVIPGATVTATNTGTNATREMPSNEAGHLHVYRTAARPVHRQVRTSGLQDGDAEGRPPRRANVRVNFTMEIGTLSETAEVTGVAPLITTENATVGTVIENRRIVELPLNGRNFLSLVALSTNVSAEFAGAGQAGDRQGGTARQSATSRSPASGASSTTTRSTARTTPTSTSIRIFCCRRLTRSKSSRCRRASTRPSSAAPPAR